MTQSIEMSRHADRRCRQRGVRSRAVRTLMEYHDRDRMVRDDCRRLSISRRGLNRLLREGHSVQEIDRVKNLVAVWSDRHSRVVTIYHEEGRLSRKQKKSDRKSL